MMLELTSAQRRALRARAHALAPVVMIGEAGLTTTVLNEVHRALASHELIKIRVIGDDHAARARIQDEICGALHAAPVQHIGKVLVVYRPAPEKAAAAPRPGRPPRKAPRRTKRSFQR